jgi:hypothetical protein
MEAHMLRYKKWHDIVEVKHIELRQLLLSLNLEFEPDQKIAERFPEFFLTEWPEGKPVPLSVLQFEANEEVRGESTDPTITTTFLVSYQAAKKYDIPVIEYSLIPDRSALDWTEELPLLPPELEAARGAKNGDTFEYKGEKLVVLENNSSPKMELICFAPASCVLVDTQ